MWDLHRLRLLRELQLRGTITAVAEALSYSPSTVSQQLAQLEREVGSKLLEPDGRRVRLTAPGEVVAAHAQGVIDAQEAVRTRLQQDDPGPTTVRIAALETATRRLIPRAITRLATSHPQIRLEVAVLPPEQGLFELEAQTFDLALAEQYPGNTREHRRGLHRELLARDPIRLVAPPDSGVQTLEDVRDRPWIMEPAGTAVRRWAEQQCRAAGFEPDVRFEAADLQAHIHLITSGHAVGLLPDLLWSDDPASLTVVDLPGHPHREIFTAVRESSRGSAAIGAVREALQPAAGGST